MRRTFLSSTLAVVTSLVLSPSVGFGQSQTAEYVPGEVLVKLKRQPDSRASGLQTFMGKTGSRRGLELKRSWAGINMHKFSVRQPDPQDALQKTGADGAQGNVDELLRELRSDPDVEYAEPNYYIRKQSVEEAELRPMSLDQFMAMSVSNSQGFSLTGAAINAPAAWNQVTSSASEVIVAIVDTGLDFNHKVFVDSNAIWRNANEVPGNGIDDDRNGYVDDIMGWNFVANSGSPLDDDGHGTHVAGIVLGTTQNIRAIPIAPAIIKIMPLKFLDSKGVGTTSDAIEAIYYATNNGARVINNSWGGGGFSNSLLDAINYAYGKKTVFVAAAGNAANNNDASPTFPANYGMPNLISVAASNDWDRLASFSNFGARSVHMGSPGVSILSTLPGDTFGYSSGTSMAAPFVSGVAALMLRERPEMNGYQIRQLIFGASEAASNLSGKVSTQSRLNVYNAVVSAKAAAYDPFMPPYDPSTAGAQRSPASAPAASGGCGLVAKAIWDGQNGSGPTSGPARNLMFFGLLLVLLAPIVLSVLLREHQGRNKRVHTRYHIDSQVRVRVGDKELVGSVSTISLGGVQLNTDAWLEHGGVVKMEIASPDGNDRIQVEGKIVWSEEQKRYGVAFQNAEENALAAISRWTQALLKA